MLRFPVRCWQIFSHTSHVRHYNHYASLRVCNIRRLLLRSCKCYDVYLFYETESTFYRQRFQLYCVKTLNVFFFCFSKEIYTINIMRKRVIIARKYCTYCWTDNRCVVSATFSSCTSRHNVDFDNTLSSCRYKNRSNTLILYPTPVFYSKYINYNTINVYRYSCWDVVDNDFTASCVCKRAPCNTRYILYNQYFSIAWFDIIEKKKNEL